MSNGPLQIKAISGHAGTGAGTRHFARLRRCKLIDVTTCIGCKACEVACLEWNGYPFRETVFDNTYQTMPDLAWNYYNLIRFNEHVDERRHVQLADAQGSVHALRRSRLPARVSGRWRDRAVFQRHRRFPAGELHRLPVLRDRLSVQYSEVQSARPRRFTSARCVRIAWARGWSRPASRLVPPAACTSAARTT